MDSPFSMKRFFILILASACIGGTGALDIAFDRLQCDESLPVYADSNDIVMTCSDGSSNRCTFGQEANIRGTLQYYGMNETFDGLGYASGNLRLLSVEYILFKNYEIDMCGDWVQAYNKNNENVTCPAVDGYYYFNIDYKLPYDDNDLTTWFATGFSGVSELTIDSSTGLLADCKIHWHTYVTESTEEGFQTMPSAAHIGIIVLSAFTALVCCCTYLTCCRRRKRHAVDISHYSDFEEYENYKAMKRSSKRKEKRSREGREAIDDIEASRLP